MSEPSHTQTPWISGILILNNSGKRYRLGFYLPGDRSVEMQPVGEITANEAKEVCEHFFRAANSYEALIEALADAQSALAMMIAPEAISTTTVINAFAAATAAEAKARTTLSQARS